MGGTIKEEILQKLPENIREKAKVTMSYQTYLQGINSNLKTVYGEYADWEKCIEKYFESEQYTANYHYVQSCEEIPELGREDIEKMLHSEKEYYVRIERMLNDRNKESISPILGIYPEQTEDSLFKWLISRDYIKTEEYGQIKEKFNNNVKIVNMVEDIMSSLFMNGFVLEFPCVGGVITQQKGQYYFRGENAFFGSSRPSLYRKKVDTRMPEYLKEFIEVLRRDECWNFLDQFAAVKYWSASSINYLAIAQHYGLKTQMIDITSNLKTALFFACCKVGRNGKWYPLKNAEVKYKDSRKYISDNGGDSRYGIIYRCPTEINDMKWAISDENAGFNIITPIGYQPFMRCSQQYGYMMLVKDKNYDMMQDPLFDKFKFRLDEELCSWIYEEMDKGNAIYPHEDIPNIEQYIGTMNDQHIFSEYVFENLMKEMDIGTDGKQKLKDILKGYGYSIRSHISYISNNKLDRINKKYTAEIAYSKTGAQSLARPILVLPSESGLKVKNRGAN